MDDGELTKPGSRETPKCVQRIDSSPGGRPPEGGCGDRRVFLFF